MKASQIIKYLAEIITKKGDLETNIRSIDVEIQRRFGFDETIILSEED